MKKARRMKRRKMVNRTLSDTILRPKHCWRSTLRASFALLSSLWQYTALGSPGDNLSADHLCAGGTNSDGSSSILSLYYISSYLYSLMSERSVPACVQWGVLCFASPASTRVCLPSISWITSAWWLNSPSGTCQPSTTERFPCISRLRETLRLVIQEISRYREKLVGSQLLWVQIHKNYNLVANWIFPLIPKAIGLNDFIFLQSIFLGSTTYFHFIGVASLSFCESSV